MQARPIDEDAIQRAVEALRRGGLVAMPTETVYGLAADARSDAAVRAVFAAKGRPPDHPVIVHVPGVEAFVDWAVDVPPSAQALAAAFWPGPLTLVLKRRPEVSNLVTGGQDTVGLRCPAHPWARALLQRFGAVVAPSANRFGRISPTTAQHVMDDLGQKPAGAVDVVLDGGPCPVGIESTILDLSGPSPRLLRPGAVSREQIEAVLGVHVAAADAASPRAPGRLEKHYAPRTPLELVPAGELAARVSALQSTPVAVLAPAWAARSAPNLRLHLIAPEDPAEYARVLYQHLRRLDASGAQRLLVAAPPTGPEWEAVADRLQRASAGSAA
ncbi:MAG TPA: L-threonylcarbamoyladenylate synthase [Burkholderiaceae bacterium]|nr:L-threonylcarbamoyladenylate synthase [Burkholderiaceae bacterium]